MSTATPELLQQFTTLVPEAARRRQAIKAWRKRVKAEESGQKSQVDRFSVKVDGTLDGRHSLLAQLDGLAAAAQEQLDRGRREMMAARQAAREAQSRQPPLVARLQKLQAEEPGFVAGWIVLIIGVIMIFTSIRLFAIIPLGVGIWLLVKANERAGLRRANIAEATERLQAEKAAEEVAVHQMNQARQSIQPALAALARASDEFFSESLEADARTWRAVWDALPPFLRDDWSEEAWRAHDFKFSCRLPVFVAGTLYEHPAESLTPFALPYFGPFLGSHHAAVFTGSPETTLSLMHAVILQLAAMLPYAATFTLLDPAGAGRAFPMQRSLPFVRRVGADLFRELELVLEDITRIIHTYIDDRTRSFEELPEQIQANERFEFIFAANFPDGYDRRTIEALQKIAKNGPIAGKYLFIQQSAEKQLPKEMSWEEFGDRWNFNADAPPRDSEIEGCGVRPLACPAGGAQAAVLNFLAAAKPPETKVAWQDLSESDPAKWWEEEASRMVSAPVGASGRDRKLNVWFGANRDGRPCAHGILGAMPGSGKSNLYHVLICGLATRYSPDELNLYLIDGKVGVEFQPYRRLPHARVVALHSAPELSRSVLEELISEMKRRNDLFKRFDVADLPGYADKGSPAGRLPRIILMVDEYQELFEDDRLNQASSALLQLAQQGRSSGIHLLLGSQRFGAVGMLNQVAIFGSIHLRMAMKMSQSDVQALTEFGRDGKRLVEQCDLPGKVVINDQSGEDKANEFGKVALLDPSERNAVLDLLVAKNESERAGTRRFATVVFDGEEQPNFLENPQVLDLLSLPARPGGEERRRIATAPVHERGFAVADWFEGEFPLALWAGQELNVHGQACVILRRRPAENLLLVGDNQAAIYGILAGFLCSLPVNVAASALRVWLVDRAVPGTPWEGVLEQVAATVFDPLGYEARRTREAKQLPAWLDEWCAELDRRAALDETALTAESAWLLFLVGADRLPALTRTVNKFNTPVESPDGEKLKRIYREGPAMGLHVVLSAPAAGPLKQLLDRAQIEQFKHRVVTQMAEADSFLLLGKDHAAKLQRAQARPVFAIYQDSIGGTETKFKPYTVDAQMPWPEQARELAGRLQTWKGDSHVNG